MASESEEEELPNITVLDTKLVETWPGPIPMIFHGRPMRNLDIWGKIQGAFLKRRPFQSRFAIELHFNESLKDQLFLAWRVMNRFRFQTVKRCPHITLVCTPFSNPSKLEEILKIFALYQDVISLCFSSIGPVRNIRGLPQQNPLVQFHSELCEALTEEGIEIGEDYRPGTWVPKCVVAEEVPADRMVEAEGGLYALQKFKLPFVGWGIEIKLVEILGAPIRDPFVEEGATFLFSKLINLADEVLWRFSVPKEIAQNKMYFPRLGSGQSVDIEVWEPGSRIWSMVLTRYMEFTSLIEADWKLDEEHMRLVAGDVIKFYKLRRPNVFIFPYEYMIKIEKAKKSNDIKDNSAAVDVKDNSAAVAEIPDISAADNNAAVAEIPDISAADNSAADDQDNSAAVDVKDNSDAEVEDIFLFEI